MITNRFHNKLRFISSQNVELLTASGSILCIKKSSSQDSPLLDEGQIQVILNFLQRHENELDKSDVTSLEKLKFKLLYAVRLSFDQDLPIKIRNSVEKYLTMASNNGSPLQGKVGFDEVLFQIAPIPKMFRQVLHNLALVINHFPKYALSNDLAVYDTSLGGLPSDTDVKEIHKKLAGIMPQVTRTKTIDIGLTIDLTSAVAAVQSLYKQKNIVSVAIVLEKSVNGDNGAMQDHVIVNIKNNMPVLLSKTLLCSYCSNFEKEMEGKDIYVQKQGGFVLVLPTGSMLKIGGFNELSFEKWTGPISGIQDASMDFSSDIAKVFLDDEIGLGFYRLISLHGHGSDKKIITNLSISEFQKGLEALQKKNVVFLCFSTCYGGGDNITKVHTPDGIVPFPILILSGLATVTSCLGFYDKSICNEARRFLFSNERKGIPFIPKSLSQNDLLNISKKTKKTRKENSSVALLPTTQNDVQKNVYLLPVSGVFDVSGELKKARQIQNSSEKGDLHPIALINQVDKIVANPSYSSLAFSSSIIPAAIISESDQPIALLSHGGDMHHVIKEVVAKHQHLEQIASNTFNVLKKGLKKDSPEPAKKAYLIGKLTCFYQGNLNTLENVLIKSTPEKRSVLFRVQGEKDYRLLSYAQKKQDPTQEKTEWVQDSETTVSLYEALFIIYDTLNETKPSEMALKQTGLHQTDEDFHESLTELFWNGSPPLEAPVFQMLVTNFSKIDAIEGVLLSILGSVPYESRSFLLKQVYKRAQTIYLRLVIDNFYQKMFMLSKSPLYVALLEERIDDAKRIIQENPEMVSCSDLNGITPLHLAFKVGRMDVVQMLLERGASLTVCSETGKKPMDLLDVSMLKQEEKVQELIEVIKQTGNTRLAEEFVRFSWKSRDVNKIKKIFNSVPKELKTINIYVIMMSVAFTCNSVSDMKLFLDGAKTFSNSMSCLVNYINNDVHGSGPILCFRKILLILINDNDYQNVKDFFNLVYKKYSMTPEIYKGIICLVLKNNDYAFAKKIFDGIPGKYRTKESFEQILSLVKKNGDDIYEKKLLGMMPRAIA